MFFSRSALRKAKNLPLAGAVDVATHSAARAQLLRALPDAVFESAPSSAGYFVGFAQSFVYKPVAASAAAFVFLAGGWITTSAAQSSLPGDTLYNVKLITERAQLQVASLDRRAVLHTEFAGNRLEEVAALQRAGEEEPERTQYISKTVTAYQQEIASATVDLQTLQTQNQTQALTTAATVLDQVAMLTESAEQLTVTLSAEQDDFLILENVSRISAGDVSRNVAEQVAQTTEAIAEIATDVALESHEVSPSVESKREMENLFRSMLGSIEARRAMALHRVVKIEEISTEQKTILAQAGVTLPKKVVFAEMENQINKLEGTLPSVMNNFAAGGYRSALNALEEMDRELAEMENALTVIEEPITSALMTEQKMESESESGT